MKPGFQEDENSDKTSKKKLLCLHFKGKYEFTDPEIGESKSIQFEVHI